MSGLPLLLLIALTAGVGAGLAYFTASNSDQLQYAALNALGLAAPPTPFASERAQRGIDLFHAGKAREALLEFELASAQQPDDINYLYEYGRILIELDDYDLAAPIGERAIAIAPGDPRGYALKARALMWSDPGSAIPAALAGLDIDPNFAPLHAALAIAYTNTGRYGEALQRGSRAIELAPFDSFTHRAYSIPLIFTGRYSQAIDALEEAVAINPSLTGPYFELAAQYRKVDYHEMAAGIYLRVLELEPENAKAYLRLCETYAEIGEFQQGSGFCETALQINPEYASAWRMLGQLQYNRRNYEGAIDSFENCVSYGSQEIECYYIRGWAYYILGNCDQAWQVLQDSLAYAQAEQIIDAINLGLTNVRRNCPGYENVTLPTPVPPTPIPPTPIGGI